MNESHESRTAGPYRGWLVIAGSFVATVMAIGSTFYCLGIFIVPATAEFGISRADANLIFILMAGGIALWGPFIGRLVDRLPLSAIMSAGGVLLVVSYITISLTHQTWVIGAVAFFLLPVAVGTAGGVAGQAAATRWFRRRRGRAIGVISVATSAGGFLLLPVAGYLIAHFGWRSALAVIGVVAGLLITVVPLLLVRSYPDPDELRRAGELDGLPAANATPDRVWRIRDVLGSSGFWLITGGIGILTTCDQTLIATLGPYLTDSGITIQQTANFLAAGTLAAIAGKLLFGFLMEIVPLRALTFIVTILHLGYVGALLAHPSFWVLLGAMLVVYPGVGAVLPVWTSLVVSRFGVGSFGTVYGLMALFIQPATMVALRFMGASHDRTGSYDFALSVFMGAILLAMLLLGSLRLPAESRGTPATGSKIKEQEAA